MKKPLKELVPAENATSLMYLSDYKSGVRANAPTFPLVIEVQVDFNAPDLTTFNNQGLVNYSGTVNDITGFMNLYNVRNTQLTYLTRIYIRGFHSYHTGNGTFSDAANDALAIGRMNSTTLYMNSNYPGISYSSKWYGYNSYKYRRASIYTHIGRANFDARTFNLIAH